MPVEKTNQQFDQIISTCRDIFIKKNKDYGTSWRIMRPSSLTDQMFIKAQRIRSIEEKGVQKVADSIEGDYLGLINYGILAIIQLSLPDDAPIEIPLEEILTEYDKVVAEVRGLLQQKNHDYGEAWRDMRVSSITDLILGKLLRIKQIEDNDGTTIISEGPESNYMDIIIYAIFASIKLNN